MTCRRKGYLKQYEEKLEEYARLEVPSLPSKVQIATDLRPIIEGFFNIFDSHQSGVLDKDESKVLFHTLVAYSSPFSKAKFDLHALVMKMQASSRFEMPSNQDVREEKSPSIDVMKAAIELERERHVVEYTTRKDEFDAAAYRVIDTALDGRFRKQDVLDVLLPDTELNNKLLEALGFAKLSECSEIHVVFLKLYAKELEKYAHLEPARRPELRELYNTLRPLIENLFGVYDKTGSGVMEEKEASTFFQSLVGDTSTFCAAIKHSQKIRTLAELNQLRRSQETLFQQTILNQQECYAQSREESNQAAFDVLDVASDGKLEKEEVVQALLPDTWLNNQFLEALGYTRIKAKHL